MARKEKNEEVLVLNEGDAIRKAMKERSVVQVELADRMGMMQSSLSGSLNRKRMSIDFLRSVMRVLDYDIAIIDRGSGEELCRIGDK